MSNPKLLDYFETKIKALLNNKVDKVPGKGLSTEDYTTAEKTKLAGIPSGGGGGGVTVDSAMSSTSENPVQNKVIYTALGNKVDKVVGKGLSTEDYTTAEKTKLAGLDPDPIMIDDELDAASTDPVQNKVIYAALANKVNVVAGKGLSTEDYTSAEKLKLDGIEDGATAVTVDASLNAYSANPVQNAIIHDALSDIILSIVVPVGNITIGTNGYANIYNSYPGGQTGYTFLCALLWDWGGVSTKDSFSIVSTGVYAIGTAGATITGLKVCYIYVKDLSVTVDRRDQ